MEDENELRRYMAALWRRKMLIAGVAVAVCILGIAADAWQLARPKVQVSILVQPAKNTASVYSNPGAIVSLLSNRGVVDLLLDRAGVPLNLVDSPRPLVAVRVETLQSYGNVIRVAAVAPANSLPEAKKVAQAVAAGILEEGRKEAADRQQVLKQVLDAITASASTFYSLGVNSARRQAVSGGGADTSGVLQGITLGNALSGMQGLFAGAFQTEKDLRLQMLDIQPPRLLSTVAVSTPPTLPLVQIVLMSALVGVAIGIVLALVVEYGMKPGTLLAERSSRPGVDMPQHGG